MAMDKAEPAVSGHGHEDLRVCVPSVMPDVEVEPAAICIGAKEKGEERRSKAEEGATDTAWKSAEK